MRQPAAVSGRVRQCALLVIAVAYGSTLLPVVVDIYGRLALTRMLRCQASAFEEAGLPFFINYGTLLGAVRHGGWLSHDRLSQGNGDIDVGVLTTDATEAALHRLRAASFTSCGHFVITRHSWLSKHVARHFGYHTAYGVRLSLLRVYAPWAPFVYIDVDDYEPRGLQLWHVHPPKAGTWKPSLLRDDIFPLSRCAFCGDLVPCPRNASAVLEAQYGLSWRTPIERDGGEI